jgi:thioredoxin 1
MKWKYSLGDNKMAIVEVRDESFSTELENPNNHTVLVYFWAEWCPPCKVLGPIIKEISEELGDQVTIAKVDVDNSPESASKFGVMSIPTLIVFQNGEMKSKLVGLQPKEQLVQWIGEYI